MEGVDCSDTVNGNVTMETWPLLHYRCKGKRGLEETSANEENQQEVKKLCAFPHIDYN